MKILHVVSCFLLSAVVCVLSGVITMRWKEGGSGHINCPYDRGYEKNPKYLSKGTYRDRVVVIQTQTHRHPAWTHQGRYSLFDDTKRRVFTVTITNPVPEDSGTYWCGVDTWGPDQPAEVRLTVDRAPVPPNPGSITSRPLLSTSHPSTNITMTTDSSNSATDRTNGTVGTTASPPTDMARTQCNNSITLTDMTRTQGVVMFSGVVLGVVLLLLGLLLFMFFRQRRDRDRRPTASKHSARLLVSDSMTPNLDPNTGTITNPIYATTTNQNPDTACDITTIYATATNPCPDGLYSNVGPTVSYTTVNFSRDPA
ncbi:CMRF35-like molecule 3 isoform X3 [Oncorhynchus tshawytscha]|uniref:CMRF35-like molecule 3 isoform X3 n=1 Tax=Oncorhynchus tshawytscha TaxID=74940 RepID=UPI001C3E3813|nr:CMRF35-like molecule 3 isoform X3 [Oncorhynchus tshawytscha]